MANDLTSDFDALSALFADKLGAKGADLRAQVYKAAPKLPKRLRTLADQVAQAQMMLLHPKLSRQVDTASVTNASAEVIEYLETIDPWDRRWGKILNWLGLVSFFLIAGFIAFVWYAWRQGWV